METQKTTRRAPTERDVRIKADRDDFQRFLPGVAEAIAHHGWTLVRDGLELQFRLGEAAYPSLLFDPRHGEIIGKRSGRLRLRLRVLQAQRLDARKLCAELD